MSTTDRGPTSHTASGPDSGEVYGVHPPVASRIWAVVRIALGFIFLWAFVDKLFGLGYATPSERSWLNGGSPTTGFLKGVEGPFAGTFNGLAGNTIIDWLFMLGLLAIGVALILGIAMRLTAVAAALMLFFMWLAVLPVINNPFLDDHLIYALVALGLAADRAGDTWGLGRTWARTSIAQRSSILR